MSPQTSQVAYNMGERDGGSFGWNPYTVDVSEFDPQVAYQLGRIAGMRIGIGEFLGKCRALCASDRVFASMLVAGNTDNLPDEELLKKAHNALILKHITQRLTA